MASGFVESMRAFPVGVEYRQNESGVPVDVDFAKYLNGQGAVHGVRLGC